MCRGRARKDRIPGSVVALVPTVGFAVILLGITSGRCRPSGRFFIPRRFKAKYTKDYIRENTNRVIVEIPEIFELANIAIAISDEGFRVPGRVRKHGDYYNRVIEHFSPFRNHRLIKNPDLHYNFTYQFRDNSICYAFDGDKIVHSKLYTNVRWPNLFARHVALVEDFAKVSNFRKFYSDNLPYYEEQVRLYRQKIPIRKMWTWLEEKFPARYDCYKVIFSPLLGSSHERRSPSSGGFRETIMFVSGPGDSKDTSDKIEQGCLSRVVFSEIDHSYVNSVTASHADAVNEAFADIDEWNKQTGYRSATGTFNEYMTWAVFVLYVYDNYAQQDAEIIVKKSTVDKMVHGRKFVRFKEFAEELLRLYRDGEQGQKMPDLYPAILDWAEKRS